VALAVLAASAGDEAIALNVMLMNVTNNHFFFSPLTAITPDL
jgi:hypothetical protein